jgi:hypothetical protein
VIFQNDVEAIPVDLGLGQLELIPFSGGSQLKIERDLECFNRFQLLHH